MQNEDNIRRARSRKAEPKFLAIAHPYYGRIEHYKAAGRATIWIKLYLDLLNDYLFCGLPDEAKWHFIGLMLMAVKVNNRIPNDIDFIRHQLSAKTEPNIQLLVEKGLLNVYNRPPKQLKAQVKVDSNPLAQKRVEREEDREEEKKTESECVPRSLSRSRSRSQFSEDEREAYFNEVSLHTDVRNSMGFWKYLEAGKADEQIADFLMTGKAVNRRDPFLM